MKYIDEYRDPDLVKGLADRIAGSISVPLTIMEVCGTHTMSIFRHGIRDMLPAELRLVSGPGCPVCVTPSGMIDAFCRAALNKGVITATFGDMMRVPGSSGSLADARAEGADVRIVYSPADALEIARQNPDSLVVFLSIGFETTAPLAAATVLQADRENVSNFCIFPANKTMPQALRLLMRDSSLKVDGLLCPGHVSIITGWGMYSFLSEEFGLCCAVAGFEPADILLGISSIVGQLVAESPRVDNCYSRAVTKDGNVRARELVEQVFEPSDSEWRGLGTIRGSGLVLRDEFARFDALERLGMVVEESREPPGCRCGDILKGKGEPSECPLFAVRCTPASPVGPCMVSTEGTCAAWYRFGNARG